MGNSCSNPKRKNKLIRKTETKQQRQQPTLEPIKVNPQIAKIGSHFIQELSTKNILYKLSKWQKLLNHFPNSPNQFESCFNSQKHSGKYLKMIKRGPPPQFRWCAWKSVVHLEQKIDLASFEDLPYGNYSTMSAIHRDLDRTYPMEPYFDKMAYGNIGQANLQRVLGKLAGKHPELGYCQSLNFLAGFLLLVNGGNDAEAFFMLETFLYEFQLKQFYTQDLKYLKRTMCVFEQIFHKSHSRLATHFEEQGVVLEMWAMQWFMTLFTTTLSLDVVARIWDIFLVDRIAVLYQVALVIISRYERNLLEMETAEICDFFKSLKTHIHNSDTLIHEALKVDLSYLSVKKMERDFERSTFVETERKNQFASSLEPRKKPELKNERFSGRIFFNTADKVLYRNERNPTVLKAMKYQKQVFSQESDPSGSQAESPVRIEKILCGIQENDCAKDRKGIEACIDFINRLENQLLLVSVLNKHQLQWQGVNWTNLNILQLESLRITPDFATVTCAHVASIPVHQQSSLPELL